MSAEPKLGLVVMAYGTPRTTEDIEPYYTHIRRGRAPEPQQLADLISRYDAIGGISPLASLTEAQRAALESALESRMPGAWNVVLGQKHATPFIEDGVAELADAGITEAVGLVLAPHFSGFSVGEYQRRAAEAGIERGLTMHGINNWHLEQAYLCLPPIRFRSECWKMIHTPTNSQQAPHMSPNNSDSRVGRSVGKARAARQNHGAVLTFLRNFNASPLKDQPMACWCVHKASPLTISKFCTTSISKPQRSQPTLGLHLGAPVR
jgi:hypothetical protein